LADARPLLEPNVRSRIAGGPERTIYVHRASAIGSQASDALRLLRWLNLVCTMVVVLATARLVQTQVGSARLAIAAGICLALVPQWSAILTMVNNDAAATLAATASFVLLVRLASGNASQQQSMMAGLAIGVALGTKLTTAFLVPAAAAALGSPALRHVRSRRALVLTAGILLASGCILLRNWIVFDDLLASGFRRAVLERSGFLALSKAQPRPGIADPAFWTLLHAQVYEAFWARFGSLGAGPDAGSRIWVIYAAISAVLGVALASGLTSGLGALMPGRFGRLAGTASRAWGEVTAATALASGLIIWVAVNLADRPEVVVHWTPRHLVPLTAPALLLASLGLVHLRRRTGGHPALWRAGAGLLVAALALAWLGSLRHAVQQMHLGYL
jgi:4-amino-4-deoxy-L-arabinose transferase-like glycosyltransferase